MLESLAAQTFEYNFDRVATRKSGVKIGCQFRLVILVICIVVQLLLRSTEHLKKPYLQSLAVYTGTYEDANFITLHYSSQSGYSLGVCLFCAIEYVVRHFCYISGCDFLSPSLCNERE